MAEKTGVSFSMLFSTATRTFDFTISGEVGLGALSKASLSPAAIDGFVTQNHRAAETWSLVSLIKLRELLLAYITTSFVDYSIKKLEIRWKNGADVLVAG